MSNSPNAKFSFQVITVFPEMIHGIFQHGIVHQAIKKGIISLQTASPREHTSDVHKTVDDRPYGGGDGMVLMCGPLAESLRQATQARPRARVVYLSPQGFPLTDSKVMELSHDGELILVCGRYGGIDQRVLNEFVDEELSVGDYILSGGELAAAVVIDAVSRQVPGVLGHAESSFKESFREGTLEAPLFTRPNEILGQKVPEILRDGNHAKIEKWRGQVSQLVTLQKRPDLFQKLNLSKEEMKHLKSFWESLGAEDKMALGFQEFYPEFS